MTFKEFLQKRHAETYRDDPDYMMDAFDSWVESSGTDALIEFAAEWEKERAKDHVSFAEGALAIIIDTMYLKYKTNFVDKYGGHKLGFFKEGVKMEFYIKTNIYLEDLDD